MLWPALLLASCLLLQRRWRRSSGGRLQLVGGWLLLMAAGGGWTLTSGGERGLALALLLLSPAAWLVIAAHGQWRPAMHGGRPRQPVTARPPAAGSHWRPRLRGLARTLTGGPLAALASFGVAMLFLAHGPSSEVNRLVAVALCAPLLWGLLLALVMMSRRLWPPALLLGALLAASWLLL